MKCKEQKIAYKEQFKLGKRVTSFMTASVLVLSMCTTDVFAGADQSDGNVKDNDSIKERLCQVTVTDDSVMLDFGSAIFKDNGHSEALTVEELSDYVGFESDDVKFDIEADEENSSKFYLKLSQENEWDKLIDKSTKVDDVYFYKLKFKQKESFYGETGEEIKLSGAVAIKMTKADENYSVQLITAKSFDEKTKSFEIKLEGENGEFIGGNNTIKVFNGKSEKVNFKPAQYYSFKGFKIDNDEIKEIKAEDTDFDKGVYSYTIKNVTKDMTVTAITKKIVIGSVFINDPASIWYPKDKVVDFDISYYPAEAENTLNVWTDNKIVELRYNKASGKCTLDPKGYVGTVTVKAYDNNGSAGAEKTFKFTDTYYNITGKKVSSDWYHSAVTFSPVDGTDLEINGENCDSYYGKTFDQEDKYSLDLKVKKGDKVLTTDRIDFNIDLNAPEMTAGTDLEKLDSKNGEKLYRNSKCKYFYFTVKDIWNGKDAFSSDNNLDVSVKNTGAVQSVQVKDISGEISGESNVHTFRIPLESDGYKNTEIEVSYTDQSGRKCSLKKSIEWDNIAPELGLFIDQNGDRQSIEDKASVAIRDNCLYFKASDDNLAEVKAFYTINGKTTNIDLTGYKSGLDKKIIFDEVGIYKLTISAKDRSNAPVEKTFTVEYNDRNVEIKLYADGKEVKGGEFFNPKSKTQDFTFKINTENSFPIADECEVLLVKDSSVERKTFKNGEVSFTADQGNYNYILISGAYKVDKGDRFTYQVNNICVDGTAPQFERMATDDCYFSSFYDTVFVKGERMLRLYISDNVSGITKAQVNCEKAEGYDDKYSSQSFEFDQQNIKIDEQTGSKYVDIRIEADFAGKIDLVLYDKAGNVSDTITTNFKGNEFFAVDATNPVISDMTISGDNVKDNYYNSESKAEFNVTEDFLNYENSVLYITKQTAEKAEYEQFTVKELLDNTDGVYSCKKNGSVYDFTVNANEEVKYTIKMIAADEVGHSDEKTIEFYVDKTKPEVEYLRNSHNIPADDNGKIKSSQDISFDIALTDNVSGLKEYYYEFTPVKGKEGTTQSYKSQVISLDGQIGSSTVKVTLPFKDDTVFYGTLTLYVTDNCGNTNTYVLSENIAGEDKNCTIIIGRANPEIAVKYDNNNGASNGSATYYSKARKAEITVSTADFSEDNTFVIVSKDGKTTRKTFKDLGYTYKEQGGQSYYTAKYDFTADGVYTISVTAEDEIGNTAENFSESFVIDKTAPTIKVQFDNNNARNSKYFGRDRTATITITERNFEADKVTFTGEGYSKSVKWKNSGDTHTAEIKFSDEKNYTFGVSCKDLAENSSRDITSGQKAVSDFVIDKTAPTGTISINGVSDWSGFFGGITFSRFSDKALDGSLSSADNLSGVESAQYIIAYDEKTIGELSSETGWKNSSDITLDNNTQSVVYAKITDLTGNVSYINTNGIIVDTKSPSIAISGTNSSKIYNGSVPVNISVKEAIAENNVYSGLKTVSYRVRNGGRVTQSGTLYSFTAKDDTRKSDLSTGWTGSITVDSAQNNSNDITVEVTAYDNSGNYSTQNISLKIDTTAPTITVAYDNNNPDASYTDIYKGDRTADITIRERNFDPDKVKISIQSSSTAPKISGWTTNENSADPDQTTHTAQVTFSADGDYTFDISCTDNASNVAKDADFGSSKSPKSFTIDKIRPAIDVTFDKKIAEKGFYSGSRLCTVTVNEHNFDEKRMKIALTSTKDGKVVETPTIGKWKSKGDTHTAEISFTKDADYTVAVTGRDKAGNECAQQASYSFTIDNTEPTLAISGIEPNSANNGDKLSLSVTAADINLSSADVYLKYIAADQKGYKENTLKPTEKKKDGRETFTFDDLKDDGIYTLYCTVKDKSENICKAADINGKDVKFDGEEVMTFSVNRNGSVFTFDENTADNNGKYLAASSRVVIYETNVDEVLPQDTTINVFRDNKNLDLDKSGYKREKVSKDGEWYQYKYTIERDVFADDGVYNIAVVSTDKAENISDSASKGAELSFAVDTTAPVCVVSDFESGKVYNTAKKDVKMSVTDNVALSEVSVKINGEDAYSWDTDQVTQMQKSAEPFTFSINANNGEELSVEVSYKDMAGNSSKQTFDNVRVTTSRWVLFYTNRPLLIGSAAGLLVVIILIIVLIVRRKRRF